MDRSVNRNFCAVGSQAYLRPSRYTRSAELRFADVVLWIRKMRSVKIVSSNSLRPSDSLASRHDAEIMVLISCWATDEMQVQSPSGVALPSVHTANIVEAKQNYVARPPRSLLN